MSKLHTVLRRLLGQKPPASAFMDHLAQVLNAARVAVVFDVGANRGPYARALFAAGFTGRVVSFEPEAESHAELGARARGHGRWRVAPPMALGAAAGEGALNVFNRTDMSSLTPLVDAGFTAFPKLESAGTQTVTVRTFDEICGDYAGADERAFLKIDTQGHEGQVLAGASARLPWLAGVQLEIALTPLYQGQASYLELFTLMARQGFAPVLFSPGFFNKRLGRQIDFDAVFLRA